jgi:hypothetical protein
MKTFEEFLFDSNESQVVDIILVCGLDENSGYKINGKSATPQEQKKLLQSTVGNRVIKEFRWTEHREAVNLLKKNPNVFVVLFSQGCKYANLFVDIISNKNKLFIVEGYAASSAVSRIIRGAVNSGVPKLNVIAKRGKPGRGWGAVEGCRETPSEWDETPYQPHWGALTYVGSLLR